ncbi:MAG: hypothetical protein IT430_02400 [Phycisphaerales bacterium]|nr:hypothetical protein [Phycisphaerales bacterium]
MTRLLVALTVALLTLAPARGQQEAANAQDAPTPASRVNELLARRLVQHSARFARPGPEADPLAGYRAAVGMLKWAARLSPDDVEIYRRLEAAGSILGSEDETLIDAERNLLRLDPDNAIAQLRVINRGIDARQSVAERLALCERLLRSPAGSRLAPEVLSQIAYRAATLAQEQGRASVAASYLEEALKLNPANLDAAALNALEIDRQTAKPELLVRAMVQLVKADPTNEAALSDLVAAVQEAGCASAAADLIEAMSAQAARSGASLPDDLFADYAYLRAADSGPREGLDLIQRRQESFDRFERQRLQAQWARERQAEQQQAAEAHLPPPPIGEMPTYDDVSVELSVHLQITRVLLALAAGASEEIDRGMASLEKSWARQLEELRSTDRTDLPASAVNAMEADERRIIADRSWTRLWVNRHVDEAAADIDLLDRSGKHDQTEIRRLRAWLSLRQGDAAAAIAGLESLPTADPLSDLGLALAQLQLGRTADATRLLGQIYQNQPGKLVGVMCKWTYEDLTGNPMPLPREARAVERELDRFPRMLGDLLHRPQRHFSLSINPRQSRVDPLDPMTFDLVLSNDSPWPVAIGPETILPSRAALFPIFQVVGKTVQTGTPPLTLDLQRRLMLEPSKSMTVPIAIDYTLFGLIIPNLAVRPMTVEIQAKLDCDVGPNGKFQETPRSLVRQSPPMHVSPWPGMLDKTPPDFAGSLPGESPLSTIEAITRLSAALHARLTRMIDPSEHADLLAAADTGILRLVEIWPELDREVSAWAVLTVPFQTEASRNRIESLNQFEAAARRSTDPLVQMSWIAARVNSPTDVVLEGALRSEDPALRAIAEDARIFIEGLKSAPPSEATTSSEAPLEAPVEAPPEK